MFLHLYNGPSSRWLGGVTTHSALKHSVISLKHSSEFDNETLSLKEKLSVVLMHILNIFISFSHEHKYGYKKAG